MKVGIVGDIHFSRSSSIIREHTNKYTMRLENCIKSVNWAENTLKDCDRIVYVGDFFDTPSLDAQTISAFSEIHWNEKPHSIIVGNHEMATSDLSINSVNLFRDIPQFTVYAEPTSDAGILYLPYILDDEKHNINDYYNDEKLVISHNDIKGINYGGFISPTGFNLDELKSIHGLYVNGHLHNTEVIAKNIIDIGNLTGQNFTEDASKYEHHIMIVDTDSQKYEFIENPFAFNFYKLNKLSEIDTVKPNAVVTIKVSKEDQTETKEKIANNKNIIASRVLLDTFKKQEKKEIDSEDIKKSLSIDHLAKFKEFVIDKLGDNADVLEEINEVIK